MRKKNVRVPIYFGWFIMIQLDDLSLLCKKYGLRPISNQSHEATAFRHNGNYVVAFQNKPIDYSNISHEVVHLVNYIFYDCGVLLDTENDEPQAYLTGWLFSEIEKFLNKKKQLYYGNP